MNKSLKNKLMLDKMFVEELEKNLNRKLVTREEVEAEYQQHDCQGLNCEVCERHWMIFGPEEDPNAYL